MSGGPADEMFTVVDVGGTTLRVGDYDPATGAVHRVRRVPVDGMHRDPGAPVAVLQRRVGTAVRGSQVVAYCHNPYVDIDRVRLHIECARWWDIDTDSAPADAWPAMTVRLTGRCWKEVRSVWISHQKAR
ncbi:hypothetical protein [Streptomyces sp. WELS2]|uniref:hypothetical protein n=1 Tax=Streptomyces sp. WELS2 TaxID=2749435 RepID=UPI00215D6D9A|nr:hypothetical protein [Streptomyces sp. WELS2]